MSEERGGDSRAEARAAAAPAGALVRFVEDLLRAASRAGVPRQALLDAPLGDAGARGAFVPWDDFVRILERLERALGGPEALEAFGERVTGARIVPVLRRVAVGPTAVALLYRAAERWALRRAMPVLETSFEELPRREDGRIRFRLVCEVPAPARPCPQILRVAVGGLRALPRVAGLTDAEVDAILGERRAEYTIELPARPGPWRRARLALRALFSSRAALEQLEAQQRELQTRYDELRAAHAELAESEARHRALAEAAIDIVAEITADGTIRYVSPSIVEITGHARRTALGTRFDTWLHPDDRAATMRVFHDALRGVATGRPLCRVRRRDDSWVWLEVEGRSYRSRTGEPVLVGILRDVSERVQLDLERRRHEAELEAEVARRTEQLERRNRELRELQTLLLEAERLGTAHDLAGRVAHSINNPLGALVGNLQLALDDGHLPRARIERLLGLAQRVGEVVERTLEFYRERKIDRAPIDVAAALEELRGLVAASAAERGVAVEVRCDPSAPVVLADRALLLAALTSLAENGIEAMPGGGRLSLETELDARRGLLLVRVADEGPGVPAELRERIFEPFFTTRASRGTGLGLPIAQGIVHGHGGAIRVADRGDRATGGAVFTVELPIDPPGKDRDGGQGRCKELRGRS